MSDPLFGAMFSTPDADAAVSGVAWLQAMLDVEAALARAAEATGLIPPGAGERIAGSCTVHHFDVADIGRRARVSASPVVPLVADLRAVVGADLAPHVHLGATSQDILDTAMGLVASRALGPVGADLAAAADRLAALADAHRHTPQLGRTLLQPALPTTFGVVCAGWLVGVDEARVGLAAARRRLAVQLGGPVGDAAGWGASGADVTARVARDLDLAVPTLPWHTTRNRVAELAAAISVTGGALATVAQDITLLAQGELAECAEGTPGGSSAMPHKRNPARSVQVIAAAHRLPGLTATILAGMPHELQRAAGRWQADWPTVSDLLRLLAAAAAHGRALLGDLQVDAARMRANLHGSDPHGDPATRLARSDDLVDRALAAHADADAACSGTA
ncbi:MAG TPA: lyase family protein [Micromonosporaceae bacterium]|nr:lyase family protein [Micromonosporaceae bacterium]